VEGWISIHRRITHHWLYEEKRVFSRFEAWIDLLLMANHKDTRFPLGNEIVEAKRGEVVTSELKLMERWGWSKTKLRNFLELCEKDGMIIKKSDRKKTAIFIVNYEDYQNRETTERPHGDHTETTRRPHGDTINNDNNDNKYIDDYDIGSPIVKIEQHFVRRRGKGFHVTPEDLRIMQEMLAHGIPTDFIIRSIDRQFENFKPKHPKDSIRTFSYCEAGIYQDWENYQQRKVGERSETSQLRSRTDQEENPKPQKSGWIRTAGNAELQDRLRVVQ